MKKDCLLLKCTQKFCRMKADIVLFLLKILKKRRKLMITKNIDDNQIKIIATDFDGTLCKNRYPAIGDPNEGLIKWLCQQKQNGKKIILWTCRENDELNDAINWCKKNGLVFDAINCNVSEITFYSRKVVADLYIDDRAGLPAWEE